ncbi:MAG TPA: AP2/ERF family transcription factor [Candidatus Nitrosocosmicus sp.]
MKTYTSINQNNQKIDNSKNKNKKNRKLQKNNTSRINGISYDNYKKAWQFQWYKNNKRHSKWFGAIKDPEGAKKKAIEYKQQVELRTGNTNGQ